MLKNDLTKKLIYGVTDRTTSNYNKHVPKYLKKAIVMKVNVLKEYNVISIFLQKHAEDVFLFFKKV